MQKALTKDLEYNKLFIEVEMRSINVFFEALSERFGVENYLSDITYALLKADSDFMAVFFEYCFREKSYNNIEVEREHTERKSRPDFYLYDTENDNKKYILEIKIYDKNMHPEYKNKFKGMKRSFIANYSANDAEKIYDVVNTWHNFIDHISKIESFKKNALINGYIMYLKQVTQYLEAKSMNLKNTKSLVDFNRILEKIIKQFPENVLVVNGKKQAKAHGESFYGKYISYKRQRKQASFWMGVYFDQSANDPYICIEDYRNINVKPKGTTYYAKDGCIYLKETLNKKLNVANEKMECQEKILYDFIKEIVKQI
jgi:hypothetical protein